MIADTQPSNHQLSKLQMYIDTSSVELFINDGEAVFTERFYSETALRYGFLQIHLSNLILIFMN